jgi:hypothetical protein
MVEGYSLVASANVSGALPYESVRSSWAMGLDKSVMGSDFRAVNRQTGSCRFDHRGCGWDYSLLDRRELPGGWMRVEIYQISVRITEVE